MSNNEKKIIEALNLIGYKGPINNTETLTEINQWGLKIKEYSNLVNYLTNEIRIISKLDEKVNPIESPEDAHAFVMELTSFLKETSCPYSCLTEGPVSQRLSTPFDRLLLLDFLTTNLLCARMLAEQNSQMEVSIPESSPAADLRQILSTLCFSKPPNDITFKTLFDKIKTTINIIVKKTDRSILAEPLFNNVLTEGQWKTLGVAQKDLENDYRIRREMLLTRLDVTIESFQWADKMKGKEELIKSIYLPKRKELKAEPSIETADLLAARANLAFFDKTSNSSVRKNTQTSINKLIIGKVPDRGGRPREQDPPPPDMPSWAPRSADRGGNRGGFRGGRNNERGGNFNRGGNNSQRGGYNNDNFGNRDNCQSGSGYNQRQDNYNSNQRYQDAGGYSGQNERRNSGGEQNYKKAKTYDSFQINKTTNADDYTQESSRNQQYHYRGNQRGRRGGGGGSNYRGRGNNRY